MGKVRTRIIGLEDIEEKQKKQQKKKKEQKVDKKKVTGEDKIAEVKKTEPVKSEEESKSEVKKIKPTKARSRGKNYRAAKRQVDSAKNYTLDEAVKLLKKLKYAKFDEAVELHLNVEKPGLRGEIALPHPIGKAVRVRIVDEQTLNELEKGKINFDILVTHPSYMPRLAKFAKTLGPKGMMPNPKTGTISDKPEEVVKKFQTGTLRWKTEAKFPLVHQMVGKASHEDKKIEENVRSFIKAVGKGNIESLFIKTTMSPSIKLDLNKI